MCENILRKIFYSVSRLAISNFNFCSKGLIENLTLMVWIISVYLILDFFYWYAFLRISKINILRWCYSVYVYFQNGSIWFLRVTLFIQILFVSVYAKFNCSISDSVQPYPNPFKITNAQLNYIISTEWTIM